MRACSNCGKTSLMAGTRTLLRGHYNPTNWTRKYPNLQKLKTSSGKRVLVCMKCLKTITKKTKRVAPAAAGKPTATVGVPVT